MAQAAVETAATKLCKERSFRMARFKQFHDPELSIWQAAVGEVEAKAAVGTQTQDVGSAACRGSAGR